MRTQRLTENIKVGYPVFKESAGVPSWLVPVCSMLELAEDLGDTGILSLGRPLDLGTGFNSRAESAAGPLAMTPEDWQSAFVAYPYRHLVGPVMDALLEVTSRIAGAMDRVRLSFDPGVIARSIAVLAYAPFVEAGKPLLEEVALVLKVESGNPAEILIEYTRAVLRDDVTMVAQVNGCIAQHKSWVAWADRLHRRSLSLKRHPKVIAVTPPASPELIDVLVTMFKEREAR